MSPESADRSGHTSEGQNGHEVWSPERPDKQVRRSERPEQHDGKRALFSSAVRRPGTLVVDCARCHGRTRVTYAEFAQRHLPYWAWTPWRRYSRYMMCPACGQRAWLAAHWFE